MNELDQVDEIALAKMFPRWPDIDTTYRAIESSWVDGVPIVYATAGEIYVHVPQTIERVTTKLGDHTPGDILAVIENGREVVIELGTIMGVRRNSSKTSIAKRPHAWALVSTLERDTFVYVKGSWRALSIDTEVVAVVARAAWLRELRAMNRRAPAQTGAGVDPMHGIDRGGRAPGEEF